MHTGMERPSSVESFRMGDKETQHSVRAGKTRKVNLFLSSFFAGDASVSPLTDDEVGEVDPGLKSEVVLVAEVQQGYEGERHAQVLAHLRRHHLGDVEIAVQRSERRLAVGRDDFGLGVAGADVHFFVVVLLVARVLGGQRRLEQLPLDRLQAPHVHLLGLLGVADLNLLDLVRHGDERGVGLAHRALKVTIAADTKLHLSAVVVVAAAVFTADVGTEVGDVVIVVEVVVSDRVVDRHLASEFDRHVEVAVVERAEVFAGIVKVRRQDQLLLRPGVHGLRLKLDRRLGDSHGLEDLLEVEVVLVEVVRVEGLEVVGSQLLGLGRLGLRAGADGGDRRELRTAVNNRNKTNVNIESEWCLRAPGGLLAWVRISYCSQENR